MADTLNDSMKILAEATDMLAEALDQPRCLRCVELEIALQAANDEIASLESLLADAGEALDAAQ